MSRPVTVLQRILNEVLKRIKEMPVELDNNTGTFWNNVTFGDVSGFSSDTYPAVGVYEGAEDVMENLYPLVSKNVPVYISFRFEPGMGENTNVYDYYRYITGRFQELFFGDVEKQTLGGLCNNLYETGNNPEIEGASDPAPGGVFMFTVQYEHIIGNPYKSREDLSNGGY